MTVDHLPLTVDQIPKSTFYMLLLRYMEGDWVDVLEEPLTIDR
jgi:hypothetical protein